MKTNKHTVSPLLFAVLRVGVSAAGVLCVVLGSSSSTVAVAGVPCGVLESFSLIVAVGGC
jgi:hypothetical protein